jgi:fermentation-respiration switch protein FrsA (DUF1100 family)
MLSYRTREEFAERFTGGLPSDDPLATSDAGAYLRARGEAYRDVMTPERFLSLSASIDRHRVDPARIACPVLLIGASSDQLVPPSQLEALAAAVAAAELHILPCLYGHDMFLKEAARSPLVAPSWRPHDPPAAPPRLDRHRRRPARYRDPAYGAVSPPLWTSDTFRWDDPERSRATIIPAPSIPTATC